VLPRFESQVPNRTRRRMPAESQVISLRRCVEAANIKNGLKGARLGDMIGYGLRTGKKPGIGRSTMEVAGITQVGRRGARLNDGCDVVLRRQTHQLLAHADDGVSLHVG
jgi:hypothetical protein